MKPLEGQAMPQPSPLHQIGKAAALSGVSAANIRFYEKEGLLAPGLRAGNGYRSYSADDIHQLRFIRLCRTMDMSLGEVRTLLNLDLSRKEDCVSADRALTAHIGHVSERLAELRALQKDLLALRAGCDGSGPQCRIMQALHLRAEQMPEPARPARAHGHV